MLPPGCVGWSGRWSKRAHDCQDVQVQPHAYRHAFRMASANLLAETTPQQTASGLTNHP